LRKQKDDLPADCLKAAMPRNMTMMQETHGPLSSSAVGILLAASRAAEPIATSTTLAISPKKDAMKDMECWLTPPNAVDIAIIKISHR
jgi:hypothetical protein